MQYNDFKTVCAFQWCRVALLCFLYNLHQSLIMDHLLTHLHRGAMASHHCISINVYHFFYEW